MSNATLGWGPVDDGALRRIVVISPHLDDAALGCGQLLAAHPGATVVTVFAGNPPQYPDPQRPWDTISGFDPADDVMAARRAEDAAALAVLDAEPVHLDFVEHSYRSGDRPVPPDEIAPTLLATLRSLGPTSVFAPFGLANPDHDVTHRAAMLVREEFGDVPWFLYEDMGYKHIPGMLAWRVSQLFRRRLWPTPACPRVDPSQERKRRAVDCYPSQLRALEADWQILEKLDAPAPEQFWSLDAPPPGWEGLSDA